MTEEVRKEAYFLASKAERAIENREVRERQNKNGLSKRDQALIKWWNSLSLQEREEQRIWEKQHRKWLRHEGPNDPPSQGEIDWDAAFRMSR